MDTRTTTFGYHISCLNAENAMMWNQFTSIPSFLTVILLLDRFRFICDRNIILIRRKVAIFNSY
ncbi:hypothetical protein SAMN05421858_4461 [Haladaptatus litoreus]|uniref:Uncharacterized protein n=1 Tax=Haladaptatus litoreus TaxID=553468 RepID=A0A1N7EP92_9EURY|nr:hypothetical protein SAMN05421858_4461 [Haladaptatus litoreus]